VQHALDFFSRHSRDENSPLWNEANGGNREALVQAALVCVVDAALSPLPLYYFLAVNVLA
jgi:hypothetical protein